MKPHKEILISIDEFETRVSILENRQLVEFYSEQIDKHRIAGNIYKGRIKDVVPGMEASFVDIGLERNAFLYVDEVIVADAELKSGSPKIQHLLEPGQELMVQVKRDPVDTKGARVTTQIALAGRKLVLLPLNGLIGVSKRLEEEERDRLHGLAEQVCPEGMGVIIRTAAKDAEVADLAADIEPLLANWQGIQKKAEKVGTPAGLSTELDLSGRVVRDMFSADYDHILIDSKEKKDEITELVKRMSPELVGRIKLYRSKIALFEKHNIESQLKTALKRKVWLRSGGYIAIDKIEALTGIDVNTAKYTGGKDLEHTIYKTNLEAAVEIVRQIRLRDIGGIIVMDFIDMKEERHREKLFEVLSLALDADRAKSRLTPISKLGLVEMTRKNISEGPEAYYYENCPICGARRIISKNRAAIEVYRSIRNQTINASMDELVFKVAEDIAEVIETEEWLTSLMKTTGKRVYLKPAPGIERLEPVLEKRGKDSRAEGF